ncbi:MAG: Bax inhibitor-1/YccA family protein [Candidatus Gracilibacteria bacterium]|nr:Bax inhibitor-1/YccA family protein [Candidatus Gracilibacteria bacterium]MDD3120426.1 Bax inhibitor-1/YccA family protein [Candidatus Gracilibacteria bacterium]
MQNDSYSQVVQLEQVNTFVRKVYFWMTVALAITAGVAFYVTTNSILVSILLSNYMILIFLQLGLVILFSFLLNKISTSLAIFLYVVYAAITGLVFGVVLLAYSISTVFLAFAITAGLFLFMSIYGYFTKTDLTSFGNILIMGLVGLVLASLVNLFVHSDTFSYILSYIGVLIFTGLAAYDTQKIKEIGQQSIESGEGDKLAIMGAFSLYLDFINLFLSILNILGSKD